MRSKSAFKVFAERELRDYLEERLALISEEIKAASDEYILGVSEEEYTQHLVSKFMIEPPSLDMDGITMDQEERMVPAEQFPFGWNVFEGRSYPRPAYVIHIPVSGETHFLQFTPSRRLMWTYPVSVRGSELSFEVLVFSDEPEPIRSAIEDVKGSIAAQLRNLLVEVEAHNSALPGEVGKRFQARKAELQKQRAVVEGIGIPLRKASSVPETFSVPSPRVPRKIVPKPAAPDSSQRLEPTLADSDYQQILRVIHDTGINLERYPSTYEGKSEEDLRDYLLLLLQPQFEGEASAETFNKGGKTDILLRYQNENVFIAECKFWSGEKGLAAAINQLFGYLTWRDSKAALVIYVRNRQFGEVLKKIDSSISKHPSFVRVVDRKKEEWWECRFTLPQDATREVTLTLMAFHLP